MNLSWKAWLGGMIVLGLSACNSITSRGVSSQERTVFQNNEVVVSRVQFSDAATARKIAISIEPVETNYDKGYMLLDTDLDEFEYLRDQESSLNISIELDRQIIAQQTKVLERYSQTGGLSTSTRSIPSFACYRTVEETFTTAQQIVTGKPTLASWNDVGDSWKKTVGQGGYDMRVLKLTNSATPGPKPIMFVTSAIHAREYATAELMTRFAEYLVNNYGTNADVTWMLDTQEVHLLLQTNPDGRKVAESGSLWRKNNNTNYCRSGSTKGADLNRNFNFEWNTGGSSANQCNETYRGPSAASEPETKTVQNYARSIFPDQRGPNLTDAAPASTSGLYLDIHSYSQLVLWSWGNRSTPAPNGTALQTLGRKFAFFNNYTPQQAIGLYATSGTTDDFVYGDLGIPAYTFELGTSFFEPCSSFTGTILPTNLNALMYALRVTRAPYQLPSGPEVTAVNLAGNSLSANANDARYNNTNGTEASQNVSTGAYYLDTPPWVAGASANAMTASDGAFNSSSEGLSATVSTAGLSSGKHTLYVRAQDSLGNWGPVSATFLTVP
jgi:carboxypeptidase T